MLVFFGLGMWEVQGLGMGRGSGFGMLVCSGLAIREFQGFGALCEIRRLPDEPRIGPALLAKRDEVLSWECWFFFGLGIWGSRGFR